MFQKSLVLLLCLMTWSLNSYADESIELSLLVKKMSGGVMAHQDIEFEEVYTHKTKIAKTDANGRLTIKLDYGDVWQINIDKIRDYWMWQVKIYKGKHGKMQMRLTYNYKKYLWETAPAVDRTTLNLETVKMPRLSPNARAPKGKATIRLAIMKASGGGLSKFPVKLTSIKQEKSYTAMTNGSGMAVFQVPVGDQYQIDIDDIDNFNYIDVPNNGYTLFSKNFTYEPTVIDEKNVNDTITQKLDPRIKKGTSSRELVTLTVKKRGAEEFWRNEPVFLSQVKGNKVYKAYTNQAGIVHFLLPKGQKYMINFEYQKLVDVFDISRSRGIGHKNKRLTYKPDPRWEFPERYVPTPADIIVPQLNAITKTNYAKPKEGERIVVNGKAYNKISAKTEQAIFEFGFSFEKPDPSAAPPVNFSIVVDKSGSMACEERIENLRKALNEFISIMKEDDFVSLVSFDDHARVLVPSSKVGDAREELLTQAARVDADGGTNIYKGIELGYKELEKHYKKGTTNRLILLTDGYGVTPVDSMIDFTKQKANKGLDCTTVGVGKSYNFALLDQMATIGNGSIACVDSSDMMVDVFIEKLKSASYPLAENVTMEIDYHKNLKFAQLMGMPFKKDKKNNKLVLHLANAYGGQADRLALIKFTLENPTKAIEDEPVVVHLKYTDFQTGEKVKRTYKFKLEWTEENQLMEKELDNEKKYLYVTASVNQHMKVMAEQAQKLEKNAALKEVDAALKLIDTMYPNGSAPDDIKQKKGDLERYRKSIERIKKK